MLCAREDTLMAQKCVCLLSFSIINISLVFLLFYSVLHDRSRFLFKRVSFFILYLAITASPSTSEVRYVEQRLDQPLGQIKKTFEILHVRLHQEICSRRNCALVYFVFLLTNRFPLVLDCIKHSSASPPPPTFYSNLALWSLSFAFTNATPHYPKGSGERARG